MTDFLKKLKKLIISNKYSLLVLLILALWLRLAKDYSVILSYVVLIILYLAIGMIVGFVLELLDSKSKKDEPVEESVRPSKRNVVTKPAVSNRERIPSHHDEIRSHVKSTGQAKVTSSYVRSTDSMPSSMSKRLERTSATFNSMKQDSDKYAAEEKKSSTLYGNTRNSLFDSSEDLYTNKKKEKAPVIEEVPVDDVSPVVTKNEFDYSDYTSASSSSQDAGEVDEISKKVNDRINEPRLTRHRRIPERREISFEPSSSREPLQIKSRPTKPVSAPIPKPTPTVEPEPTRSVRKTHVVPNDTDDKVNADMDKLDKLFNRNGNKNDIAEEKPKSGFFSGLKKKDEQKEQQPKREIRQVKKSRRYVKPPVDLLRCAPAKTPDMYARAENEQNTRSKRLIDTLASFGVGAKITGVLRGPAVTRYELQPNPGVKVSKIVSLSDDIALNLAATGVRIEAPIPGKEAVGIEVPNKEVEVVCLHDVIASKEYRESQSKLTFAIGKDIAGKNIVADIAKMPHLLIAGATGSGKSVCINTIITSILYKSGPDDVKMIMIDPKIVELGIYNGIPHLFVPVVTNPKKAAGALAWAVAEMEKRYEAFSQHNVRDLKSYNEQIERNSATGEKMPQVVIIIDELADLMMVAAKEIEESIIRLAQKARAAGIHLIIATQRPSVDVITGLIKANIPSRIAFAVTSQVDSRTILDGGGAEKLLGRGDMLFHPIGMSKPLRVQGAFVSDGEVEALVEHIKDSYGQVEYSNEIAESIENEAAKKKGGSSNGGAASNDNSFGEDGDSDEELIREAAELAFEFNQISTSFLQRKLRLGYSRASRIVDALEDRGVVSAADGSKPRKVIITKEEFERIMRRE